MRIDHQLKAALAREFCAIIADWRVTDVAKTKVSIQPGRVSELRHGKLDGVSIGRLARMIAEFNYDIEVAIRPTKRAIVTRQGPKAVVIRYDALGRPVATDRR